MKKTLGLLLLLGTVALVGCGKKDKLVISGEIAASVGDTLMIKTLQNNELEILEQRVLKSNGRFKFSLEKDEFPQYYFLQVNNGFQLVLIEDSCKQIEVRAASSDLRQAKIEGSDVSVRIQEMQEVVDSLRKSYHKVASAMSELSPEMQEGLQESFFSEYKSVKNALRREIYKDTRSYYAYYALYQRFVNGELLFSPYDETDFKCYAAVATAYDTYHKEDPRTKALYTLVDAIIKQKRQAEIQKIIDEAPSGIPNIVMNDVKGVEQNLSSLQGKVVILNFWASANAESRQSNRELLLLYNKYKSRGVEVFQVSVDKSKILWEQAIEEDQLPWINVCDFKGAASVPLMHYNVRQLPMTFVIDRKGELVGRMMNFKELEDALKKAL